MIWTSLISADFGVLVPIVWVAFVGNFDVIINCILWLMSLLSASFNPQFYYINRRANFIYKGKQHWAFFLKLQEDQFYL